MTPLKIAGQGSGHTHLRIITSENASGGADARKLNHTSATIAFKNDLLNVKRSPSESVEVDVDAFVDSLVLATETAANDLMQEDDTDALINPQEPPLATAMRYQLLTDDDMHKLPEIQWQIKNVLPSRGTAVMFGPSGSGKSFLALDMLQSLAFGRDWFGHKVKQCSVTYIALEGEAGVAGRIKAYQARHGSTSSNIRYVAQGWHKKVLKGDLRQKQSGGGGDVGFAVVVHEAFQKKGG